MDTLTKQLDCLDSSIEKLAKMLDASTTTPVNNVAENDHFFVKQVDAQKVELHLNSHVFQFNAEHVSKLIQELALARPKLSPVFSKQLIAGTPFVSTKNPDFVVQKQNNGDRLVFFKHHAFGWVPITISPDNIIALYMILSKN